MMSEEAESRLTEMRQALDQIDRRIAEVVSDRFGAIREIGELKRSTGIPMMQETRLNAVMSRAAAFEAEFNIPAGTLTAIFSKLTAEACRVEDEIIYS